ncbi:DUF4126 domain-containing protein [Microvirga solisilvae]|uniref:DUF4126 domain-containing protein n=1 Tax=Microvirga solisilvae TaxID=2919498 RepID=UPI001FAEBE9E|nr:DUF4126 domain-containing protein [Microvirga solisilvae]
MVAGLRTMMAPVTVSWGAALGYLNLEGSWLAFLGYRFTPWILSLLALGELLVDKLPSTPSRKVPMQFGARIISGALSGAAIGFAGGSLLAGLLAGAGGAVVGTLGGAAIRARLSKMFRADRPAALIEDAVSILVSVLVIGAVR